MDITSTICTICASSASRPLPARQKVQLFRYLRVQAGRQQRQQQQQQQQSSKK
jgi:hypothetical protein